MSEPDPDLPLVRRLQAGDDSALNELMDRHQVVLHRFLWRLVGHETNAAEIAQATFVRVYFHIQSFEPRAKFATWLYHIARNLCRDYARSKHHRQTRVTDSLDAPSPGGDPNAPAFDLPDTTPSADALLLSAERLDTLQAAISRLPLKLREPLVLCDLEGLPQQQAAECLGITTKAVETRAARARKLLAKHLRLN